MSDDPFSLTSLDGSRPEAEHGHHNGEKHKKKVRSAWISFIGRIIAQIAGAAAAIVIGLAVLDQYPRDRQKADPSPATSGVAVPALPPRVDPSPNEIDLAVLPFEYLSADDSQAYVADGIAEAVLVNLACIEGLHVVSRTSSMQYRAPQKPLSVIATELAVDFVVEGAVTVGGGRIRVTAQLVDASTDHEVWARSYDRPLGDMLALQADLASAIARQVTAAVMPSSRSIRWSPGADAPCSAPTSATVSAGGRGGG